MSRGKGHVPIRTCISCGDKREKHRLLRIVIDEKGCLQPDEKGSRPGRGAYICRSTACVNKALEGKRLERAFRYHGAIRMNPAFDLKGLISTRDDARKIRTRIC